MDREQYVSETERQLTEFTFYKALDHEPTNECANKMSDAIPEMRNSDLISKQMLSF